MSDKFEKAIASIKQNCDIIEAIDQLGQNYQFENKPDLSTYFTNAYLPKDGSLVLK